MINVNMHASLSHYTNNESVVTLAISTVDEMIPMLCQLFPRLKRNLVNEAGELSPYVNCYINGKHITAFTPKTVLQASDKIDFVTALVGG